MGKNPAFQWYPADWLRDAELHAASWDVRGLWIEMLNVMWYAASRGAISGTVEQLSRMVGATPELIEKFLSEAECLKFCDLKISDALTLPHKNITVINRRMHKEEKARNDARLRQQKAATKRDANKEITPPSPKDAFEPSPEPASPGQNQQPEPVKTFSPDAGKPPAPEEEDPLVKVVVMSEPFKDAKIPKAWAEATRKAYPRIDLESEVHKAAAWCVANPKQKKTLITRFLNNWFKTEDNKLKGNNPPHTVRDHDSGELFGKEIFND